MYLSPEKALELITKRREELEASPRCLLAAAGFSTEELKGLRTTWEGMKARCGNPSASSYANYGGRGIRVTARWMEFHNFVLDMGKKPTPYHTLDRKDYDGDYSPENCRWATQEEQTENRRYTGTSGVVGVRLQGKYWTATGFRRGRSIHLYCGDSFEEAVKARRFWEIHKRPSP